jgi:hypothetical protein
VYAGEPAAADVASAKRLFNEATALESRGQWPEAADKLREAIGIKETPGLRYHLAYAEEHMGQLVEALSDYDRAAVLLEAGAQAPDVAKLVGPARDRVRERTPTLLLRLPPNVAQAKLTVDERPVVTASLQQPIPLNPGAHRLVLTAPGHEALTLDVRMSEGERQTLDAELTPRRSAAPGSAAPSVAAAAPSALPSESPSAEPETAERPAQASGGTLRTVVLASEAGIAVAALGVGIGYMLRKNADEDRVANAQRDVDESSTNCNTPTPSPACRELAEAIDDSNRSRRVSNIAFVTAGVAAAAAVVTFVVWPARSPGVRVGAHAAPQTAFVTVSGAF